MKKQICSLAAAALCGALLAGCAGKPAVSTPSASPVLPSGEEGTAVKTGLYLWADPSKSTPAAAGAEGLAQADINFVAVSVGDDGIIDACVIDSVQAKVGFDSAGRLTTKTDTQFPSKNELGREYGMHKASGIGKEWSEQVQALADYVVGKSVEELRSIDVQEDGKIAEADLASSVTIAVGGYLDAIETAAKNAVHLGAEKGDTLKLTCVSSMNKSHDAAAGEEGLAQPEVTAAAVTLRGDVITSCAIDGVQVQVKFDAQGSITSDLSAPQPTKNELGESYGMKKASGIGKEWNEQAAAFCRYVSGKTPEEVAGIHVDEDKHPTGADLAGEVTISIGNFQSLIAKAGEGA